MKHKTPIVLINVFKTNIKKSKNIINNQNVFKDSSMIRSKDADMVYGYVTIRSEGTEGLRVAIAPVKFCLTSEEDKNIYKLVTFY